MEWADTGHLSDPAEMRASAGRSLRAETPIEVHAEVDDAVDRPDPIGLLLDQDVGRLQTLVPIRHARMGVTPFTFYRGAASVMASDLARVSSTGIRTQLCGDAHLSNFGVFFGPDRRLVFDLNDFDETAPGPFEWDLKRLAASVTIAGRNNELTDKQIGAATRAVVAEYRAGLAAALTQSPLQMRYYRIEVESLVQDNEQLKKRSRKALAKATRKDSMRALHKLTEVVDGHRRIIADPPLIVPIADLADSDSIEQIRSFFEQYRSTLPPHRAGVLDHYRAVDVAHKVVGVGSVGTRCLIMLMESGDGAPLFLQMKQATRSVLEDHIGDVAETHAGERVVRGQRLMQSTGDVLLGWSRFDHGNAPATDYYFRQLWDGKGSAEVDQMGPKRLKRYAGHCGATLALAHARTGDAAAIHGYLGDDETADRVFEEFALRYADVNERDHDAHQRAIDDGRIAAAETL